MKISYKSCSYLGCTSRNPRHAELWQKVGACVCKASGDVFFITIGNCRKAFIWIPFMVKHIMKMFMLQIKEQIQILIGNNIFFLEWIDLVEIFCRRDQEIDNGWP